MVSLAGMDKCFNPCFRGSRPRTRCHPHRSSCVHLVSILVFVEVALGRWITSGNGAAGRCFNPCFRGSRPRTLAIMPLLFSLIAFQSLFSWKSPSDSFRSIQRRGEHSVSILVFVEVALGPAKLAGPSILVACFNPCFRGSRPRTALIQPRYISRFCVSILVFVEVALGHYQPGVST